MYLQKCFTCILSIIPETSEILDVAPKATLTPSDYIQLFSVFVALALGVISIIISIVTLRKNSKIIEDSKRAQIEIFPIKIAGDSYPKIRIQNFGATSGTIIDIKTNPVMPTTNILKNPFEYYNDLTLAPQQSFTTVFSNDNAEPPIKQFSVTITYKTLGKTITTIHPINYNFTDGILESRNNSNTPISALDKINQSIRELR